MILAPIIQIRRMRNLMNWTTVMKASFGSPMMSLWSEQRALLMTQRRRKAPHLNPSSLYLPSENSAGNHMMALMIFKAQ